MINVADFLPDDGVAARAVALSPTIATMEGSRILAAASEARALRAKGVGVCDLTVGDFAPEHFQAPESFLWYLAMEIEAGQNQYPPSDGIPELQQEIVALYARELGVQFPTGSVVVCGGARPPIYAAFRCLLSAGDKVLFPVPSWNNDYYTHLCDAEAVQVRTSAETNFFPTVDDIKAGVRDIDVKLVCLCSPLNPCGTVIAEDVLRGICQVIVEENQRRAAFGWKPVFLMFDQVYWPLTFGDVQHQHPLALVPEIAPWVIYIDAISKWMVSTGLRLGWAVVPPYLYAPMRDFMGHVGGWAPRPVQVAAARFLREESDFLYFRDDLRHEVSQRLMTVRGFFDDMQAAGLPVESTAPQGAIYISVRLNVMGMTTPSGQVLRTNDDVRRYILTEAQVALVAFQAFSLWEDTGWFRISVGAVGVEALEAGLQQIQRAIEALR